MTELDDDIVSVCNAIKSNICSKASVNDFSQITPQIIADCGPLKKKDLAKHLITLISSCDQYDHMTRGDENIAVSINFDQAEFENNIKELIENNIKGIISPSDMENNFVSNSSISNIEQQLLSLQASVDGLRLEQSAANIQPTDHPINPKIHTTQTNHRISNPTNHVDKHLPNYMNNDQSQEIFK